MNCDRGRSSIIIKKSVISLKLIQFINQTSKIFAICSAITYQNSENDLHITENEVENILFEQYIDANVLHFYMKHL